MNILWSHFFPPSTLIFAELAPRQASFGTQSFPIKRRCTVLSTITAEKSQGEKKKREVRFREELNRYYDDKLRFKEDVMATWSSDDETQVFAFEANMDVRKYMKTTNDYFSRLLEKAYLLEQTLGLLEEGQEEEDEEEEDDSDEEGCCSEQVEQELAELVYSKGFGLIGLESYVVRSIVKDIRVKKEFLLETVLEIQEGYREYDEEVAEELQEACEESTYGHRAFARIKAEAQRLAVLE
mmetsp:Transcript_11198/g.25007  ORF Transcript_11198/g.25007 Transcript_11198/m.25007 type:complete len:239 (-) Transcript_11198:36-752(-)